VEEEPLETIAEARHILPAEVHRQLPPNLPPRLCVHEAWIGRLPPPLRRRAAALHSQLLASGHFPGVLPRE
jgi:hypothetical protein